MCRPDVLSPNHSIRALNGDSIATQSKLNLESSSIVSDHYRLLVTLGRVAKPLISPLMPVPYSSIQKVKSTMLHQRTYGVAYLPVPSLEPVGGEPLMSVTCGHCDARPMVTFPAARHHRPLAGTKLYCLVTEITRKCMHRSSPNWVCR